MVLPTEVHVVLCAMKSFIFSQEFLYKFGIMLKLAVVFLSSIILGVCDAQQECQKGVVYENRTVCVDLTMVLPGNQERLKITIHVKFQIYEGSLQSLISGNINHIAALYHNDTILVGNSPLTVSQCGFEPDRKYVVAVKVTFVDHSDFDILTENSTISVCQCGLDSCQEHVLISSYFLDVSDFYLISYFYYNTGAPDDLIPQTSITCYEHLTSYYTFPPQRPGIGSFSVETCNAATGEIFLVRCLDLEDSSDAGETPLASIRCSSQGVYDLETLQTSTCESIASVISQNFTNSTLKQLEILTAKPEVLTGENVADISGYLFNVSKFNITFSEEQIGETAEISSHLTSYYREKAPPTEFIAEKQKLVKSITDISRKVEFDSGASSVTKLSDNVNIEVREVKQSTQGNTDYTFNAMFYENGKANFTSAPISIKIPAEALDIAQSSASSDIRIVSVGFRSSFLFPSTRTSDWVISSSLGDFSGTVEGISLPDNSIVVTSDRTEEPGKKKVDDFKSKLVELECVFWNFTIGNWSSEGCTLSKASPPTCQCNHLTHFAILVSRSEIPADFALTFVTYVGCGMSIIGFIATLLVICVSRILRTRYHMRILGNICFCLALAFALFVFGVDHRVHTVNCSVLTVFMHFFFLASWFWMSVYSYAIYRDIGKVMKSHGRTFKFSFAVLFAYGVPLLIVLINSSVSLGHIDQDFPDDPKAVSSYRAQNFCWLRLYSLYFGFLLPVGILLLFNIVVFCFVIPEITCKRQKIQSSDKKSGRGRNAVTIIVLVTTMGLTWVFGYLMLVSDNRSFLLAMSWLFTIVTSSQGVFIFYFTAVRSGELGRLCPSSRNSPPLQQFQQELLTRETDTRSQTVSE